MYRSHFVVVTEMTGGASYGQYPQGVQPQPGVSGETDPRYADQCSVQQVGLVHSHTRIHNHYTSWYPA